MTEDLKDEERMTAPLDIAELRRIAGRATPTENWGAFIAAFNPETALRLLDELAEAQHDAQDWLEKATYEVGATPRFWKDRAEAAEAELDATRALLGRAGEELERTDTSCKCSTCRAARALAEEIAAQLEGTDHA